MTPNKTCNGSCQPSCCESTPPTTVPMSVHNPAGLTVLRGRVGDHRSFFESLRRRLSSQQYPQLSDLKTRSLTDPTIALLDSWSVVCDVLTFYNERYLQEAYQRTAKEARSLQELSKLIGYRPGPGVASSVYLAFTLEKSPEQASQETLIKKGTKVQSVPGANESAQTFETMEDLVARPEWSAIRPRQTRPQDINLENIEQTTSIVVDGITPRMVANDLVVFDFGPTSRKHLKYVIRSEPTPDYLATTIFFAPTSFDARLLIDHSRLARDKFAEAILTSSATLHFPRVVAEAVSSEIEGLRAEDGLVATDKSLEDAKTPWSHIKASLSAVKSGLETAMTPFKFDEFIQDAKTALLSDIAVFDADELLVEKVVEHLREAWDGTVATTGFKNALVQADFDSARDALRTAVGTVAAGSTDFDSVKAALVSDVDAIDTAQGLKDVRKDFLKAWARFSDWSVDVFESREDASGTQFAFDTFENLAKDAFKDYKDALNAVSPDFKKVVNTLMALFSDDGILGKLVGGRQIKLRESSLGSFGPVQATGLTQRLSKLTTSCDALMQRITKFIEDVTNGVSALSSNEDIAKMFALELEVAKDILEELKTPGTFDAALHSLAMFLSDLVTSATKTLDAFDGFVLEISRLLGLRRASFKKGVKSAIDAFGDEAFWLTTGDVAAQKAAALLKKLREHIDDAGVDRLIDMTNQGDNSLIPVLDELGKNTELNAAYGSVYAVRKAIVVNELERLRDSVGEFSFDSAVRYKPDNLPDTAGLSDALAILANSANTTVSEAGRHLRDIVDSLLSDGDSSEATVAPDLFRQIASTLSPQLKDALIAAWKQISSSRRNPRVFAHKTILPLFGFNAGKKQKFVKNPDTNTATAVPVLIEFEEYIWKDIGEAFKDWREGKSVYLSQPVEGVSVGSVVVFRNASGADTHCTVTEVLSPVQPGVLNISAAGSYLKFGVEESWHGIQPSPVLENDISLLKRTSALLPSHEFQLVEVPIRDAVGTVNGSTAEAAIELNGLYPDLEAGRVIVIAGLRFQSEGMQAQEIAKIKYVSHRLAKRANDKVHTHVEIDKKLVNTYSRGGVQVFANVVRATHGETTTPTLANGDASKAFQTMTLGKGPLTYLPAPNETGVESTLEVRVNDIQWHETQSLLESPADGRNYVVQDQPEGMKTVQFGDGKTGARLPTGNSNVLATYRTGLGKAGNVRAKSITNLVDRPMGVKEVINPLPATGGADPETVEQIRANAPLAVMALDRLVSIRDYADFARNFAGIDKAVAMQCQVDSQPKICVTIAGADDAPLEGSALIRNLVQAYQRLGDPLQSIQVRTRELLLLFLGAKVRLKSDYFWESVKPRIQQSLYDRFSFARRELAQPVYLSDVYTAIQNVDGVEYVDVDLFGTLSQSKFQESLEQSQSNSATSQPTSNNANGANLSGLFKTLVTGKVKQKLDAHSGQVNSKREFEPAQLIYLSPDVSDSLYLDEVKS